MSHNKPLPDQNQDQKPKKFQMIFLSYVLILINLVSRTIRALPMLLLLHRHIPCLSITGLPFMGRNMLFFLKPFIPPRIVLPGYVLVLCYLLDGDFGDKKHCPTMKI